VPLLEGQLAIGLLDEDPEEPTLELEADLIDVGLDPVGEMLILMRHGQGHLE
jgi:aryl carrier-like protein